MCVHGGGGHLRGISGMFHVCNQQSPPCPLLLASSAFKVSWLVDGRPSHQEGQLDSKELAVAQASSPALCKQNRTIACNTSGGCEGF